MENVYKLIIFGVFMVIYQVIMFVILCLMYRENPKVIYSENWTFITKLWLTTGVFFIDLLIIFMFMYVKFWKRI